MSESEESVLTGGRLITLMLTEEEVRLLLDLSDHNDEGPQNEGWQSPVMKSLAAKIYNAISVIAGDRIKGSNL